MQRNSVQFISKKPQMPVCTASTPALKIVYPPKELSKETLKEQPKDKLPFDRIDELTRPSAYSAHKTDTVPPVSEPAEPLGTKFILRTSQELTAADTLPADTLPNNFSSKSFVPKRFALNLPEWPRIPEMLAAAKEETEQEKQRTKWQEALYRYENQKNKSEDNTKDSTEPQITPMSEPIQCPETERSAAEPSETVPPKTELPEIMSAKGLTKSYKKGKLTIPVLCGVDLTIGRGEFVSVAGQSGSGKSTFLHLLGTLDKPDSGSIHLEGRRIDNLPRRQRDNIRNRSIGFIFQFYHLLPELTTLENVLSPLMIRENFWGYVTKRRTFTEQGKDILNVVGLSHRLNHKPSELSGGEMQRAAIARALVASPKVLLADEPTGNLDSKSAGEIIGILQQLNQEQGLTVVMITHDNIIAKAADRMVRMLDGVIVSEEAAHLEERLLRRF
jgi:lipoprotein-releasing system ATP-binding protein